MVTIMNSTFEQLMDASESAMRLKGYHAVSFRDLADELGIKSASVHYYFRQKEDLGVAVVERYSDRLFAELNKLSGSAQSGKEQIEAFCKSYQFALKSSDKMCLCGLLGAEISGLPDVVGDAVRAFLNANIDWVISALPASYTSAQKRIKAAHIVSTMQGAMMLSTGLKNYKILDDAVEAIISNLPDQAK